MKNLFNWFRKPKPEIEKDCVEDETVFSDTKMSLAERIEWRTAAAHRAVIHIFETFSVAENMFSFLINQIDVRGHEFNAMICLHKNFKFGNKIKLNGFNALEHHIQYYAKSRYGIKIVNVFWKSSGPFDLATMWEEAFAASGDLNSNLFKYTDKVLEVADLPSWHQNTDFGEIDIDHAEGFRKAVEHGSRIPAVKIKNKEYDTDFSPYN